MVRQGLAARQDLVVGEAEGEGEGRQSPETGPAQAADAIISHREVRASSVERREEAVEEEEVEEEEVEEEEVEGGVKGGAEGEVEAEEGEDEGEIDILHLM